MPPIISNIEIIFRALTGSSKYGIPIVSISRTPNPAQTVQAKLKSIRFRAIAKAANELRQSGL